MTKLLLILAGFTALVLFIVGEGWRQRRAMRKRGARVVERPSLIGTGMLELQAMLEPERKVEVIQADMREKDRVNPGHQRARPGDGSDDDGFATPDDASEMAKPDDKTPH